MPAKNRQPPGMSGRRDGTYFLGAGGLFVRPGPDGAFGTLLGQFGVLLLMVFLQKNPGKKACAGPGRTSRTLDKKVR